MNTYRINHRGVQVLVTFLLALSFLLAGARVPDLSRPHGPKASHRIVLETQHKAFSSHIKQQQDLAAALPERVTAKETLSCHAGCSLPPPLYAYLLSPPNSGRSPPAPRA